MHSQSAGKAGLHRANRSFAELFRDTAPSPGNWRRSCGRWKGVILPVKWRISPFFLLFITQLFGECSAGPMRKQVVERFFVIPAGQ